MNDNQNIRTVPGQPMSPKEIFAQQTAVSRLAALVEPFDAETLDAWERAGHAERRR